MDVFRVFDALNDIRNVRRAIAAVRSTGKHAQGTICYTVSPLHTVGGFVEMAEKLVDLGCDSICIKDMAALLKPQPAYDIVKAIKEACGEETRVHVHVHATTGVTLVSLMKAIEAGADCVDTAISSLSLGPGHNPTESLVEMLEGTGFDTKLDKSRLLKIKKYFAEIRPRYQEFLSNITGVETEIFDSQIPGGMISNMESQLKQQGAGDRMKEVLLEVPKVREDAGFPPLVTPSSQIVGTQAVFNVMMGRYKVMTGEFADLMLGYYGETLGPRDPRGASKLAREAQPRRTRSRAGPADLLKPEWDELRSPAVRSEGLQRLRRRCTDLRDVPAGGAEVLRGREQRAEESGQGSGEAPRQRRPRPGGRWPEQDNGKGRCAAPSLTTSSERQDAQGDSVAGLELTGTIRPDAMPWSKEHRRAQDAARRSVARMWAAARDKLEKQRSRAS